MTTLKIKHMKNTNKKVRDVLAEVARDKKYSQYAQEARTRIQIGAELFKAREKAGISQRALAKLAGTTQKVISNIEGGDLNPGICLLQRIAQELRMRFIFGDAELSQQGMTINDILHFGQEDKNVFSEKITIRSIREETSSNSGNF